VHVGSFQRAPVQGEHARRIVSGYYINWGLTIGHGMLDSHGTTCQVQPVPSRELTSDDDAISLVRCRPRVDAQPEKYDVSGNIRP
jgi:hypothetical protein